MRILNRILFALLIIGLLGAMMPVAAETVAPNNNQSNVYWRFVSPSPRPGNGYRVPPGLAPATVDQSASLAWLVVSWLFGIVF